MKTKLSFFLLFIAFSAIGLQAKNSSPEQEINGNQTISSLSLLADTLAIPWREDFESITREDDFPYGMSCTYRKNTQKAVRTFMVPATSSIGDQVKARSGNKYMVFVSACNDWVFTPGLFLRAGTEYTFSFWYDVMSVNWTAFEAKVGLSPTPEAMTIRVTDSIKGPAKADYKKYEGSFVADKDAVYYFGIHAVNSFSNTYLSIDDLEVNTTPPACKTINLFARNITTSSIEFYRAYTPVANYKIVFNYRREGTATWNFMDVSNKKSILLSGLTANTKYDTRLGTVCSAADTLWTPVNSVITTANPIIPPNPGGRFPIIENFDKIDTSLWRFMNDSLAAGYRNYNKWYIDTVGKIIQGRTTAYVSGDGGISNTYTTTYYSISRLYTHNFLMPEAEEFSFSFAWRAFGKNSGVNSADYLRVILADTNLNLRTTTVNNGDGLSIFGDLRLDSNMKTQTAILPGTYSNTAKKLVFIWRNNTTAGGISPAAAIDSIIFIPITCATPKELSIKKVANNSLILTCNAVLGSSNTSFDIAYKEQGTSESNWKIKSSLSKMDSLHIEGLTPNTNYDIKVRKRYGIDSSLWTAAILATTALPYIESGTNEDFENFNTQKCIVLNGTQPNKWMVGSKAEGASGKAIYISKDAGASNQYDNNATSIVHFYYDLDFAQADAFRLSFDWKCLGSFSDFLRISLVDLEVIPEEGKMLPAENRIFEKDFYNRRTWAHEEILFDKSYTGTSKRLVFTWKNTASNGGLQPAMAIDNIRFDAMNCAAPENLMVIGSDQSSIALMAKKPEAGISFVVNYKKAGSFEEWFSQTTPQSAFISEDKLNLTQLEASTTYEIKVRKQCGADTSLFTPIVTARTIQVPANLPLSENFETETSYSKWRMLNEGQPNQWMIGNAVANGGLKSLYITDEAKKTNTYSPSSRSVVHFYRDVKFSEAKDYILSFDWKGGNANSSMSVYIADINQEIQSGISNARGSIMDGVKYSGTTEWENENITITKSDQLANSTRSLVFTWTCDGTGGEQAPFAIDNIELKAVKCSYPKDLKLVGFPESSISDKVEIQFTDIDGINDYVIGCTNLDDNITVYVHADTIQSILSGLKYNANYEVKARTLCPQGDSSLWSKGLKFKTPQKFAVFPIFEGFEYLDSVKLWTRINGETGNKWFFGDATSASNFGNQAAYIDSLNGTTNGCKAIKSIVHLYRDIEFPASDIDFLLHFQWKEKTPNYGGFEDNNLHMKVNVVDLELVPVAGAEVSSNIYTSKKIYTYNDAVWNDETLTLPESLAGKKKRLVFSWYNENGYIAIPPVAIDNISMTIPECNTPQNIRYKALSPTLVQLDWTCKYTVSNSFNLEFENRPELNKYNLTDTSIILELRSNTAYDVSITNECGGKNNIPVKLSFRTIQQTPKLTYNEYFSSNEQIAEWTFVNGNNQNKWIAGNIDLTGENTDIKTAAFVSSDDGETNKYVGVNAGRQIVHMYRDIYFDSTDQLAISFDWRGIGYIYYDYMKVYVADSAVTPVINTLVDKKYEIVAPDSMRFALQRTWKTEYFSVKGTKNKRKRLIFSWQNALYPTGDQPPAAFSNLHVQAIGCTTPSDVALKGYLDDNAAILTWKNVGVNYILRHRQNVLGATWDSVEVENRNFDTLRFDRTEENVLYEVQIMNNCGGGSAWSPLFYFNTLQRLDVPFFEDFSEPKKINQWNTVNGTQLNAWYIDTAVYAKGKGNFAAYISDNNGRSNTYTGVNPESSITHLYRDIEILDGQKEFQLQFDWKAYGQNIYDYMQVYLINKDSIPKAGKLLPITSLLTTKMFNLYKHDWKREDIVIPAPLKTGRNRLVFTWKNNEDRAVQSPAAIDNIAVNMSTCLSPINIASTAISQDSIALKWNTQKEAYEHFNLRYKKVKQGDNSEIWEEAGLTTSDSNYVLRSLTANRLYEIQVQTKCPSDTSVWRPYFVQTKQIPVGLPLYEDFESDTAQHSWVSCNGEMPNAWYVGRNAGGTNNSKKSAYISDEGGSEHQYLGEVHTFVYSHFYKDITFSPAAAEYLFSFQWKAVGNSYDYLQVYLADVTTPVTTGALMPSKTAISGALYNNLGWANSGALLPDTLSEKTKRLVFSWTNNTTGDNHPPAAIDNISITTLDCKTPADLKVVDYPDLHSAVISWSSKGDTFAVSYGKATEDPQTWPEIGVRGDTTITLRGLDSNTVYYVKVKNNCAKKTIFSIPLAIRTLNTPITEFPYSETFEKVSPTKDKWIIVNGNQVNAWHIGTAVAAKGGEQSMYISNDGGVSNAYGQTVSATHFYRDITFPMNGTVEMSFDWKCYGYSGYDYLRVSLIDIIDDPTPGDSTKGRMGTYFTTYRSTVEWKNAVILFQDTNLKGKRKRVLFTWMNKSGSLYSPPAIVDNITFNLYSCSNVQNLQTEVKTDKALTVSWQGVSDATSYTLAYKTVQDENWIEKEIEGTAEALDELQPNTYYSFKVTLNCDLGSGKPLYDTALLAASIPLIENFNKVPDNNWGIYNTLLPVKDSITLTVKSTGWIQGYFANFAVASSAAKTTTNGSAKKEWLVSPQIYLLPGIKTELEFNVGLTFYNQQEGIPDRTGINDRFVVLVSKNNNKWSAIDALLAWDNKGYNLEYNEISYTRIGNKIKVSLENYSGLVRIAFYSEATGIAFNNLFIDSVIVRPIVCEKVQDVHVSKIGLDSAFVAWTAPAEQYEWQVQCATMDGTLLQTDELLELYNVELKALQMNTEYNVSVRSICNENDTSDWFIKKFTTKSTCANSPSTIEIVPTDSNAIVNWIADTEHVSWELRYGFSGKPKEQMSSIFTTTPSFTINNLTELTEYDLYIRAICEANHDTSNWANKEVFTTHRTPCIGVSNVAVSTIKTNSAVIAWEAPQGQQHWEVRYGSQAADINAMNKYFVTETNYTLSNLNPNATYEVVVRSICRADDSSLWSARKQFTTQDCGTVSNLLVVKNTNGNSAELSWTAKPEHTKWRIGIDTNNNFSTAREEETTENPYTIDYAHWGVEKTKSYYISIKALCGSHLVDTWSDQAILTKGEGIDDLDNARIQVNLSPNPANDYTKLSIYGAEGVVNVQIYSVKGELILTEKLNCIPENTKDLVIKGLQRGAYTLRIVHEKWTRTEKLIMQ